MLNKPSISHYYDAIKAKIRDEVESQPDDYIASVNIDEYAEYLFNKYSFQEIIFDGSRDRSIEKIKKLREINDFGEIRTREIMFVRIMLPVVGYDKIREILELGASQFTLSPPRMEYHDGYIVTEVPASESDVERAIREIEQEVEWRNKDIKSQNGGLGSAISQMIQSRKAKIEEEDALLESIAKKVSVPLKQKLESSKVVPPSLKVKQKIQPIMPPKATPPVELHLELDKFNAILTLIDNCCRMFERTPSTYSQMEEEQLRNVILSSLNAVFEGDAMGEAFSKLGKTDILLKVSKGGIFIAECKYWKGAKTVEDSVDQILDYLTWRHSYGLVILFSKNKGFSGVIESLSDAIPKLRTYVKGMEKVEDTHFKAEHHLPEDDKKIVELHYLVYNLYARRSKSNRD